MRTEAEIRDQGAAFVTQRRARIARACWESIHGPLPASGGPAADYAAGRTAAAAAAVERRRALEGATLFDLDTPPTSGGSAEGVRP